MAGNTKLIGFAPDMEITLERWGVQTNVQLSEESILAIREACFKELPKEAPSFDADDRLYCRYDSRHGRILLEMTPDVAEELAATLQAFNEMGVDGEEAEETIEERAVKGIVRAVQKFREHTGTEGEPGIEPS